MVPWESDIAGLIRLWKRVPVYSPTGRSKERGSQGFLLYFTNLWYFWSDLTEAGSSKDVPMSAVYGSPLVGTIVLIVVHVCWQFLTVLTGLIL
jgi:hypothetical protein